MGVINDDVSRRRFLSTAFMGFGLFFGLGALFMRFSQFLIPKEKEKGFEEILVGVGKEVPAGGIEMNIAGNHVILLKGEKGITAFSRKCTDLGCLIEWNRVEEKFICPCHHGVFDKNGKIISGPPPRPLDRFDVVEKGEYVYVRIKQA